MRKIFSLCALLLLGFLSTPVLADVSPETVPGATTVDAAMAKQLFDEGVLFVDVRKDLDWDAGRIPDALHLDIKSVFTKEALMEEAALNDKIVIYCNGHSCPRSSKASAMAVEWGFSNVYYFRDGLPAWKNAGYPVE